MRRIVVAIALVVALSACTSSEYRFRPEDQGKDRTDVQCGIVEDVYHGWGGNRTRPVGRYCLDETKNGTK